MIHRCLPHFLAPRYDSDWDIPGPPDLAEVRTTINKVNAALYVETHPNYYGLASQLDQIAAQFDETMILADEAHGSHFKFSPAAPPSALDLGAHVSVQSFHKTLGSLTQASVLHVHARASHLVPRIDRSLMLLQTTSPSPLLLSSLEAATVQTARSANTDWSSTILLAEHLHERVNQLGARTLKPEWAMSRWGVSVDPFRVVMRVADWGWSGLAAASFLRTRKGIQVELANQSCLVVLLSPGNTLQEVDLLVAALDSMKSAGTRRTSPRTLPLPNLPHRKMEPWDALEAPCIWIPIEESAGRVCAEMVCPYPPGIPVLIPGEEVTDEVVEYLVQIGKEGWEIRGLAKGDQGRIAVVR